MGGRAATAVFLLAALCSPRSAQASCSGGKYANTCSAGNYCDTDWWDSCESMSNCPSGYYRQQYYQGSNQPSCQPCPANSWCNGNSYSFAVPCPAGTFSKPLSPAPGYCQPASPPPPSPVYLVGNVPISYFNDFSANNVPNAPYTLQFSKGLVYNVGTQYLLGRMASSTEKLNTFIIPIVGGAGPCPNGAMRSGQLQVTCSAATTSFTVNENPMCTYDMTYVTTQACPPGTVFPSPPPPPPGVSSQCPVTLVSGYYNDGAGKCQTNGCTQGMCCSGSGWCGTSSAYCGMAAPKAVQFANSATGLCMVAGSNTVGSAVTAAPCSATNPLAMWAWGNTFVNSNYNAVLRLNGGALCLGCTTANCNSGSALQVVNCNQAPVFNNNGPGYAPGVLAANTQACLTYTNGKLTTAACPSPTAPAPDVQRWVGCTPPPPSPPPPPPTVYTSRKVSIGTKQYIDKVTGGPTQHKLNNGATTSSTETTADGKVLKYATTTTTDATRQGTGSGHIKKQFTSTTTSDVDHPQTFLKYNSSPPSPNPPPPSPSPPPVLVAQCPNNLPSNYYNDGAGRCQTNGCTQGMCCSGSGWCGTSSAYCGTAAPTGVKFANSASASNLCLVANSNTAGSAVTAAQCSSTNPLALWAWGNTFVNSNYNAVLHLNSAKGPLCLGCTVAGCGAGSALQLVACAQAPVFNNNGPNYPAGVLAASPQACLTYTNGQLTTAACSSPAAPAPASQRWVGGCAPPPPSPSPPPPTVYTSQRVQNGANQYTDKVLGGPTQHVLNGGATTSSTETTADGKVLKYVTTTTTDVTQRGTGNGHIKAQSTSTTTSDVDHPQTFLKYNSPPPMVYSSTHVLDQTTGFGPKVTGGPTQHVLNGGATTTSTETTATGKVKKYVTTTTTDATQQGTGNGHIQAQSTDTSTTATDHQQTFQKHNTHTSTTDLPVPSASILPPAPSVCGSKSFAVQSGAKAALCMHVKGGVGPNGFVVSSTVKRPVITMPCVPGSPNQQFMWEPSAHGGVLVHTPSMLAMSLASATVSDGTAVVLVDKTGALTQEWEWPNAANGGTISSAADDNFMITDSRVNADVSVGLPVHMWRLKASLPSGAPNAQWFANCGN